MIASLSPRPSLFGMALFFFAFVPGISRAGGADWDSPSLWTIETDRESTLTLRPGKGMDGVRLGLHYTLQGPGHRWVQISRKWDGQVLMDGRPLTFLFRADSQSVLEVKIEDMDGSVFLCRFPLNQYTEKWEPVVLYRESFEYGWGGDGKLDRPKRVSLAVAGSAETGSVFIDEIGPGQPGTTATPVPDGPRLDPARNKTGLGFKARRAKRANAEDPGVYEWLKAIQDSGSLEGQLLPSMEDNRAQTFNNALCAIVFIMKDDRARAERILDFFAQATNKSNTDIRRQNFFVNGEPRGFYQEMYLRDSGEGAAFTAPNGSDRWMGDMAWLLIASHYYSQRYDLDRYAPLERLLQDQLMAFYQPAARGGYIRHGWRRNDTSLHEPNGHPEGNLDAYAALHLVGEEALASQIKTWLHTVLVGSRLPLDLYTWRVLAFGPTYTNALAIPESDFRYRKTVRWNGRPVTGFFHSAVSDVNNIWVDGLGQMACAYYEGGEEERANFYSNQMDALFIDREVDGRLTRALPYATNGEGGLQWVRGDRGFTSTAAWYLFAKNRFNPFTLRSIPSQRP